MIPTSSTSPQRDHTCAGDVQSNTTRMEWLHRENLPVAAPGGSLALSPISHVPRRLHAYHCRGAQQHDAQEHPRLWLDVKSAPPARRSAAGHNRGRDFS